MREGLRTTGIGLVIGLLLAAGIGKLVSGLLYRVSPFDPVVMSVAAAVLSTAAMLACYLPARRATRVVPLEALRSEETREPTSRPEPPRRRAGSCAPPNIMLVELLPGRDRATVSRGGRGRREQPSHQGRRGSPRVRRRHAPAHLVGPRRHRRRLLLAERHAGPCRDGRRGSCGPRGDDDVDERAPDDEAAWRRSTDRAQTARLASY